MGNQNGTIGRESGIPAAPPAAARTGTPAPARPGTPAPAAARTGTPALEAARNRAPRTEQSGTGTPARAEEKQSKETVRLPVVKPRADVTITPENEVNVPKPKQKRGKKAKAPEALGAEQLSALIGSLSDIVASRAGEHWKLSKNECMTIAEPAAKLVNNSEQLKQLAEHSDALALVMACVIVFAPRVLITAQNSKQKRVKNNAAKSRSNRGEVHRENVGVNEQQRINAVDAPPVVPDGGKLYSEIDIGG